MDATHDCRSQQSGWKLLPSEATQPPESVVSRDECDLLSIGYDECLTDDHTPRILVRRSASQTRGKSNKRLRGNCRLISSRISGFFGYFSAHETTLRMLRVETEQRSSSYY